MEEGRIYEEVVINY